MEFTKVKIEVYLPMEYLAPLRDALHEAGACRVGKYDHVVSYQPTEGFWRPLPGSEPYDGKVGEISCGCECKLEFRCDAALVDKAVKVIRCVHPYEEPLINILPLLNEQFGVE